MWHVVRRRFVTRAVFSPFVGIVLFHGCDVPDQVSAPTDNYPSRTPTDNSSKTSTRQPTQQLSKQSAKPSPEQLRRWVRPKYEPLQLLAIHQSGATGYVTKMTHTPNGNHFILGGSKVTHWSVGADEPEHVYLELAGEQHIKSLATSPDGKWFAAGDNEGVLRKWRASCWVVFPRMRSSPLQTVEDC
jgi:WD40 repeat protein